MGNIVSIKLECPIKLEMIETFPNGYIVIASNAKIISLYDDRSPKFTIGRLHLGNMVEDEEYTYAKSLWWFQFVG